MTREDHKQDSGLRALRAHLNTRPDLLLAIAMRHATNPLLHPVPDPLTKNPVQTPPSLRLSVPRGSPTYDALGIKLRTKAREVDVDIPLQSTAKNASEVKQAIDKMGEDALKYYKVPKDPQVNVFVPPKFAHTLVLLPLALLIYLAAAPSTSNTANAGRALVSKYLSDYMIPAALMFSFACHIIVEPLLLIIKIDKHRVPIIPALCYMFTVVLIGFGGLNALDRAVVQERIRLVRSQSADTKKSQ
ncbi:hypothetical protein J007_06700 [Cryptococcus neoformans]|nr:hypothetical protein C356_06764 [Cryptococcus neoformans var. grubii c45]OXB33644.1 hypothetical protein J007_06700 [Cryptococcus neoformans var. grubii]OXC57790.1 hypothetical protein C358_06794 [Cryptococcus neoformans var. grubii MW-RSA852]